MPVSLLSRPRVLLAIAASVTALVVGAVAVGALTGGPESTISFSQPKGTVFAPVTSTTVETTTTLPPTTTTAPVVRTTTAPVVRTTAKPAVTTTAVLPFRSTRPTSPAVTAAPKGALECSWSPMVWKQIENTKGPTLYLKVTAPTVPNGTMGIGVYYPSGSTTFLQGRAFPTHTDASGTSTEYVAFPLPASMVGQNVDFYGSNLGNGSCPITTFTVPVGS